MSLIEKRKVTATSIIRTFSISTLGLGYLLYLALRFMFNEMGKRNVLVTLRTAGEIKTILKGEDPVAFIMSIENHRIDPDGFDIFKGSFESYAADLVKAAKIKRRADRGFIDKKLKLDSAGHHYQLTEDLKTRIDEANTPTVFEEIFGVAWVGFPPYSVFTYTFRWLKHGKETPKEGEQPQQVASMHPRYEKVDSLFFRYTQYGIVIDDVETGAGSLAGLGKDDTGKTLSVVQVRAELVFETITRNPKKTLMRTSGLSSAGEWLSAIEREIRKRARTWLGASDWDKLVKDKDKTTVEIDLASICVEINGVDKDGSPILVPISAIRDYGQEIVVISLVNIDLKDKKIQEAYERVVIAQRDRDSAMAKAEGDRAIAAAPVLGEADGFEKIAAVGGREMYMAKQMGNIRVYAPGRDNMFLNIADEASGGLTPSQGTPTPKTPKDPATLPPAPPTSAPTPTPTT